ncbi:MAG: hypothetical protein MJ154_03255 [Candidatus Saccharibacteria bacterium]|nr:hypothetical protein [Candidatus Saccharibacteria bacterium]
MRVPTWWKDYQRLSYIDPHWLIIWIAIYICFLSLDIFFPNFWGSALIKYVGIFLCIVYANQKYRDDYTLQLALLFTFLADTILVWTPFALAGVYVFCFAQFMHLIRLTKLPQVSLGIYTGAFSFFFAIAIANGLEPIYAIATVYALELLCNFVMSINNWRANSKHFRTRCAFYGFMAFLCCDFCVALRFLALNGSLSPQILPTVSFLVWVFYYPSQVLVANSSTMEPSSPRRKVAKSKATN